jgi:hypothetical protein
VLFTFTSETSCPRAIEFKIIKGSGHLIPIDEPVQLAK